MEQILCYSNKTSIKLEKTSYNNQPFVKVKGDHSCWLGWPDIIQKLNDIISPVSDSLKIIVIETYQGVIHQELAHHLKTGLKPDEWINSREAYKSEDEIKAMVYPDVTDDRIFGYLTRLNLTDYLDRDKTDKLRQKIINAEGIVVVYGPGASLLVENHHLLVYADMARWEIQQRMRQHQVDNLGLSNRHTDDWMLLYKQGYFVDWRVCDRLKKKLYDQWDFVLDTNQPNHPKMITGTALRNGLEQTVQQPFSVVPFFDPGPWGGQWMKHHCNLSPDQSNYAWCFNCVPEENSLLLKFGNVLFETPSINLVFCHPRQLLGDPVHARFGDEFPIRFDFLDTMEGGNLSLQVHPLTEYIQEKFGLHYTQDESYYLMEAGDDAVVYLGLKEQVEPSQMIRELELSAQTGQFEAEKHVQTWPVKKHDHVLIPAGTVHCSGKNSMVLEISATPYIFTFKLWDWGRVGLDGKPRPINIGHGKNVIQWDRTSNWVKQNLIDQKETVAEGEGWWEEKTGLHDREFIETRRHWFTQKFSSHTGGIDSGSVHVICLVEGDQVEIKSPELKFEPFLLHYAEVVVIPAGVGGYTISPVHPIEQPYAVITAFVRH